MMHRSHFLEKSGDLGRIYGGYAGLSHSILVSCVTFLNLSNMEFSILGLDGGTMTKKNNSR